MLYLQSTRVPRESYFLRLLENTWHTIKPKYIIIALGCRKNRFLFSLVPSLLHPTKKHIIMRKIERKKNRAIGYLWYTPGTLFTSTVVTTPLPRGHLHPEAKSILANASAAWKIPSPGQPEKCRQLFDLGVYRGSLFKGRRVQ